MILIAHNTTVTKNDWLMITWIRETYYSSELDLISFSLHLAGVLPAIRSSPVWTRCRIIGTWCRTGPKTTATRTTTWTSTTTRSANFLSSTSTCSPETNGTATIDGRPQAPRPTRLTRPAFLNLSGSMAPLQITRGSPCELQHQALSWKKTPKKTFPRGPLWYIANALGDQWTPCEYEDLGLETLN